MSNEEIMAAGARAKAEISAEIDRFLSKLNDLPNSPSGDAGMQVLISDWKYLSSVTDRIYADLVAQVISLRSSSENAGRCNKH